MKGLSSDSQHASPKSLSQQLGTRLAYLNPFGIDNYRDIALSLKVSRDSKPIKSISYLVFFRIGGQSCGLYPTHTRRGFSPAHRTSSRSFFRFSRQALLSCQHVNRLELPLPAQKAQHLATSKSQKISSSDIRGSGCLRQFVCQNCRPADCPRDFFSPFARADRWFRSPAA